MLHAFIRLVTKLFTDCNILAAYDVDSVGSLLVTTSPDRNGHKLKFVKMTQLFQLICLIVQLFVPVNITRSATKACT